jgi:hypothetical protein
MAAYHDLPGRSGAPRDPTGVMRAIEEPLQQQLALRFVEKLADVDQREADQLPAKASPADLKLALA